MTSTIQSSPCGLIVFNDEGKLTYINSALCALIGRARKKLVGRDILTLLSPKVHEFYQNYLLPLLRVGQEVTEVYVPLIDDQGHEIPMILSCNRRSRRHGQTNVCTCTRIGRLASGESDVMLAKQELEVVNAEKSELLARLGEAYSVLAKQANEWEKLKEELGTLAYHDILTGLVNRRGFEMQLDEEHLAFMRTGTPFSILIVDVDHFKRINDTYGHAEGDIVLKRIADVLSTTVRKLDLVARWGGEEFVMLLPETDQRAAKVAAERVREAINSEHFGEFQVTVSVGAATCDRTDIACSNLMISADRALYAAKNSGRNRTVHAMDMTNMADRRSVPSFGRSCPC